MAESPDEIFERVLKEEQEKGSSPPVAQARAKAARLRAQKGLPTDPTEAAKAASEAAGQQPAAEAPAEQPAAEAPAQQPEPEPARPAAEEAPAEEPAAQAPEPAAAPSGDGAGGDGAAQREPATVG
ncbi:MAG: hypothetical protein ACRDI1_01535, partial [Actinomycetota bacterium]